MPKKIARKMKKKANMTTIRTVRRLNWPFHLWRFVF
jgi:hypothetical protein